jgi:hypothetical protein
MKGVVLSRTACKAEMPMPAVDGVDKARLGVISEGCDDLLTMLKIFHTVKSVKIYCQN